MGRFGAATRVVALSFCVGGRCSSRTSPARNFDTERGVADISNGSDVIASSLFSGRLAAADDRDVPHRVLAGIEDRVDHMIE